jgi:hypothetical protein
MALNPNIILSGMPQPFDTNALLQQQISGMENINALERQRRADELAMQDRAVAQEKAAQAEAARALAPAVAAAFADPTDAGLDAAFSMVPGEYAEAAEVQLSQLRGIPDVKRRKDVIRAALLQDEYGQALLAQLEPTANMRLQADTAAQAQAVKMRELQLEEQKAARGPEPSYKEVILDDGTLVLMDTKSGRIIQPSMEGPIDTAVPPQEGAPPPLKVKTEATKDRAAKEKAELGKTKVEATLDKMLQSYQKLKDLYAIVSTEREGIAGTFSNIGARAGAALGTTVGRATGTKAQTERDVIQNLRMDLVRDIKQATGMSAQELNSNFELQAILDSLSDPYGQSYETAIRTIQRLSEAYGKGSKADISTGSATAPGAEGEDPELNELLDKYLPK